ncbi:succinyl-diaminopimelate desuccinylase [uncultured Corynebacterium sp.]|uniref:succinyl-diaminopimelate desuccinylase n=1 Tax=uncultured Corynebacterium sp. TaxID=159447 RepID=UPI0025DC2267|nr:succinyl-diaminopimelate desuccinylase [uncultured Corynebacterium sp.]
MNAETTDAIREPLDALDLRSDPVDLTAALIDVPSVSRDEARLADAVEAALRDVAESIPEGLPRVTVERFGDNVVARTHRGLDQRVILAGHLDTVPIADNVPSTRGTDAQGRDTLFGCGAVDMKSGDACYLHAFATLAGSDELQRDLTLIMYACEEIAGEFNGLGHLADDHPELLDGDVALLGEPSGNVIEAGCQGSIRLKVTAHGTRAHSARSWLGDNAAHRLAPVLARVAAYRAATADIDGLTYREGMQIVHLEAGVATNTLPDVAWAHVNFRFAPNRDVDAAMEHFLDVLAIDDPQIEVEVDDVSPGALPGLDRSAAKELVAVAGGEVKPKFGWTDVSRFAARGIPAVNFGPGDPAYCHKRDEQIPVEMITRLSDDLRRYLTTAPETS